MRSGRLALGVAVCLLTLAAAPPASAAETEGFSYTADSGGQSTKIQLTSKRSCPDGHRAMAAMSNHGDTAPRSVSVANMNEDGSWVADLFQSGLRNGDYRLVATCIANDASVSDVGALIGATDYEPGRFVLRSDPGQFDPTLRLAGDNRIATAIRIASDMTVHSDEPVVLSRADSFADALAGAPLAHHLRAPLLLNSRDQLDTTVADLLRERRAPGSTVYLLGGEAALSSNVEQAVRALGLEVVRIAGANRFETAVRVAETIGAPARVLLADGLTFNDGLVAGAAAGELGGAVLLTDGATLPPATSAYLASHAEVPRSAVGRPAAAAVPSAEAIVGTDPITTAIAVAERFFPNAAAVGVSSVTSFADALSGGVHIASEGGPLLFTEQRVLNSTTLEYLERRRSDIVVAFVYGGFAAISQDAEWVVSTGIN